MVLIDHDDRPARRMRKGAISTRRRCDKAVKLSDRA
jgi:hypothetical protein